MSTLHCGVYHCALLMANGELSLSYIENPLTVAITTNTAMTVAMPKKSSVFNQQEKHSITASSMMLLAEKR